MGGKKKSKKGKKKSHDPHVDLDYDGNRSKAGGKERPRDRFVCLNHGCNNPCWPAPHCGDDCAGTWYCSEECAKQEIDDGLHAQSCRPCPGASNVCVKRVDRLCNGQEEHVGLFAKTAFKRGQVVLNLMPYFLGNNVDTAREDRDRIEEWMRKAEELGFENARNLYERAMHEVDDENDPITGLVLATKANGGPSEVVHAMELMFSIPSSNSKDGARYDIEYAKKWIEGHSAANVQRVMGTRLRPKEDRRVPEDFVKSNEVILRVMVMFTNYLETNLVKVYEAFNTRDHELREGYYPLMCWINHSCSANLEVINMADNLLLVARSDIEADEELTISYRNTEDFLAPKERTRALKKGLGFDCRCNDCESNQIAWGFMHHCVDPDSPNESEELERRAMLLKKAGTEFYKDGVDGRFDASKEEEELMRQLYELRSENNRLKYVNANHRHFGADPHRKDRSERSATNMVDARYEYEKHMNARLYDFYWRTHNYCIVQSILPIKKTENSAEQRDRLKAYYARWREATKSENRIGRPSTFVVHANPTSRIAEYILRFAVVWSEVQAAGDSVSTKLIGVVDEFLTYLKPLLYEGYDPMLYLMRLAPHSPLCTLICFVELGRRRAIQKTLEAPGFDDVIQSWRENLSHNKN